MEALGPPQGRDEGHVERRPRAACASSTACRRAASSASRASS
jgi:hypothetical protein